MCEAISHLPSWQAAELLEQAKTEKSKQAALAQKDVQMQQLEAVKRRILAER